MIIIGTKVKSYGVKFVFNQFKNALGDEIGSVSDVRELFRLTYLSTLAPIPLQALFIWDVAKK